MNKEKLGIVVGVDGSPLTTAVCDYATWLARRSKLPLTLLHTINHDRGTPSVSTLDGTIGLGSQEELLKEIALLEHKQSRLKREHGKLLLKTAQEHIDAKSIPGLDLSAVQRHGEFTETVVELEDDCELLVLGKRGEDHADERGKIGGKLNVLLRSNHVPTLIVPGPFVEPRTILVGCDEPETAERAIATLTGFGLSSESDVHLVCVNKEAAVVEGVAKRLEEADFKSVSTTRLTGDVATQLENYQVEHGIQMTVMGAYSHTRLRGWLLGSFTTKMLVQSEMPLLLVR